MKLKTKINKIIQSWGEGEEVSVLKLAKSFHCSDRTVNRMLEREGIQRLHRNAVRKQDIIPLIVEKEYEDYILFGVESFTSAELCQIFGKYVEKFDIHVLYNLVDGGKLQIYKSPFVSIKHITFDSIFSYLPSLFPDLPSLKDIKSELRRQFNFKRENNSFRKGQQQITKFELTQEKPVIKKTTFEEAISKINPNTLYTEQKICEITGIETTVLERNILNGGIRVFTKECDRIPLIKGESILTFITKNKNLFDMKEEKEEVEQINKEERCVNMEKIQLIRQRFFPKDQYFVTEFGDIFGGATCTVESWIRKGSFHIASCPVPENFSRKNIVRTEEILQFILENQYEDFVLYNQVMFSISEVERVIGRSLGKLYTAFQDGYGVRSMVVPKKFSRIFYDDLVRFLSNDSLRYKYSIYSDTLRNMYIERKRNFCEKYNIQENEIYLPDVKFENIENKDQIFEEEPVKKSDLYAAYRVGEIAISWGVCITDVLEWFRMGYFGDVKLDIGICFATLKEFVDEKSSLIQESQERKRNLIVDGRVYGIQNLSNILDIFPVDARGFFRRNFISCQYENKNEIFDYFDIITFQNNCSEYHKLLHESVPKLTKMVENIGSQDTVVDVSGENTDVEEPSYTLAQCNEHLRDSVVHTLSNFEFTDVFDVESQSKVNQYFSTVYDLTKKLEGQIKKV